MSTEDGQEPSICAQTVPLCPSPASGKSTAQCHGGGGRASAAATAPRRAVYSNNHYSVVGSEPPGEGLLCVKRFGHVLAEAGRGRVRAARSRCGRSPVLGANAAVLASFRARARHANVTTPVAWQPTGGGFPAGKGLRIKRRLLPIFGVHSDDEGRANE